MMEVMIFILGAGIGFGLGMFAGCMLSFAKTQDAEMEGDEHGHF